jgi:hypothetical protein
MMRGREGGIRSKGFVVMSRWIDDSVKSVRKGGSEGIWVGDSEVELTFNSF